MLMKLGNHDTASELNDILQDYKANEVENASSRPSHEYISSFEETNT